jgi:DNA-binding response OmpR family regulator
MSRILLVEDDKTIGRSLRRALEVEGYEAAHVTDAATARAALRDFEPDLILLDLGLPDEDGVDLCRDLRANSPGLPIVVLTARQEETDVVIGLDAGADDYITKPFRLAELLARVRTQFRRPSGHPDEQRVVLGDLELDADARRVWIAGQEIALRPREFDLLALLAAEEGRVVRRERIMSEIWDEHWFGSTKTLDVHMSTLRRKMNEVDTAACPKITAIPRVGYRLDRP